MPLFPYIGLIGAIEKIGAACIVHLTEETVHLSVQESGSEGVDVFAELHQVCPHILDAYGHHTVNLVLRYVALCGNQYRAELKSTNHRLFDLDQS